MQDTPKNGWGGSRGGGRPPKHGEPTISITFALPESLAKHMDTARRAKGQKRSEWLVELTRKHYEAIQTEIAETDALIEKHNLPL
jgi:hypothetical protein